MTLSTYQKELTQFMREHAWSQVMDERTATAFYRRWSRAGAITDESNDLRHRGGAFPGQEPDGSFTVCSSRADGTSYEVWPGPNGSCDCPDSAIISNTSAPYGWCKHRLAVWIFARDRESAGLRSTEQEIADLFSQD